jgi:hypothetical protein
MTWNPQKGHPPLISLVLATKNALPHVATAVDALKRQTYKNFELLVQDGGSTDGTLEYFSSLIGLPKVEVVSEPDSGIGQAYSRGLCRCSGDLVCLVSSDEYLDDDALERAVGWFVRYPEAAIIYGGMRLLDAKAQIVQVFIPPGFELVAFLKNEVVPPTAAAFLNRSKIGEDLYYDESLKTCPDYDFWLRQGCRLGPKEVLAVREVFLTARADRTSMTYRAESYDQFCHDKLFVLNRFLDSQAPGPLIEALRRTACAGILTWAAESVFALEGVSRLFLKLCTDAARLEPSSPRLLRLVEKSPSVAIDSLTGHVTLKADPQPDKPLSRTMRTEGFIDVKETKSLAIWGPAKTENQGRTIRVTTGSASWGYAAEIPLFLPKGLDGEYWYWVKIQAQVLHGQVGIGILIGDDLLNEKMIAAGSKGDVFVILDRANAKSMIIRNGGLESPSVIELSSASVEYCPKQSRGQPSIDAQHNAVS